MASEKKLLPDAVRWLEKNHSRVFLSRKDPNHMSFNLMADHMGVCADTLKRLMISHGFASFASERYRPARGKTYKMWTRPCMICKTNKPRPHGKYICTKCKLLMGWVDED